MSTTTKRIGSGVVAIFVALVLLVGAALALSGDNKADAVNTVKHGNSGKTASLNKEAATWVRLVYMNFKGSDEVPDKITNWKSSEDLSTVHFYNKETNKESKTAFGPDMGKTPEKVSMNLVERLYRDPALVATVARDLKLTSFKNSEQAKVISELENDAAKRRTLANKVLGWYANPDLELTIEKHKGGYSSDVMSGSGTTSSVKSNGTSNVLTATDEKSGKVMSQRRLDCGGQVFKPSKPNTPKGGCKHNCTTPPCIEIPGNGVSECNPKDPSQSTQSQGNNKPGGGGTAPAQTDPVGPPAGGTPPPTYTPAPAPTPTPVRTTTPTQPPEGGSGGNNDNSGDPGAP